MQLEHKLNKKSGQGGGALLLYVASWGRSRCQNKQYPLGEHARNEQKKKKKRKHHAQLIIAVFEAHKCCEIPKTVLLVSRHILKGAENEAVYLTQGAVTSDVMCLSYSSGYLGIRGNSTPAAWL